MPTCNVTLSEEKIEEVPLWKGFTFHHFGLFLSAAFALVAVIIAFFLIFQHATHYSKPWEQKHIIRILFMIPVYAVVSFLSYMYYRHAIYFEVIRDCYEAFAISAFFALMCSYIERDLHDQKEYFRNIEPRNWVWPITWHQKCTGGVDKGWLRKPRSGLTWFNIIWICIFQYCFIRVFFTAISVATQATGRYCESSLNPAFAHIWVMVFEAISVTVAMYCLIQFYIQLKKDLAQHRPGLKIVCIKLVIFFCFWQSLLISFLSSSGTIKTSEKLAYPDIKVGIPSMLLCVEMALFAILHIWAFSWRPYDNAHSDDPTKRYQGGFLGLKAYMDAFNPWDIVKASARGFRWLFVGAKNRHTDASYRAKQATKTDELQYTGVTFAGTGEPATELAPRPGSKDKEYDDRVGLLSHAQSTPGGGPPPYNDPRTNGPYMSGAGDLGDAPYLAPSLSSVSQPYVDGADTRYYGVQPRPPPAPPSQGQAPPGQWDVWAGNQRR